MLACLGITGGMRTAPTAAFEVLLGLPPLHLKREVEGSLEFIHSIAVNTGSQITVMDV
jgi:hypothetical protein